MCECGVAAWQCDLTWAVIRSLARSQLGWGERGLEVERHGPHEPEREHSVSRQKS